ncbi:uroporphyrinogen-III C-methyltransferase [Neptuniibacter sp. 2_MG-2023]|uniref:uroporphyrinogen-III C-methyltransferase n=1 Tax=Neptuniibacter sp. 2_MG-2023 TaxID=3062671 RepID=UPI0026E40AD1|nr:uroporphyrinogen-III C-methyltransferase [Neptuniibacter sp. 2_MG-2023]MDO6514908.1 uroporphyrinogen-III C-methyltransferase [Neptuniibacter sp. 2_MG-2023]
MSDKKKTPQEESTEAPETNTPEVLDEAAKETTKDTTEEVVAVESKDQVKTTPSAEDAEVKEAIDEAVKSAEVNKTAAANEAAAEKLTKKEKQRATWPGKLALPLSIIALGAAGYLYWLSLQQTNNVEQNNAAIEAQVSASLSAAQGSIDQSLASMNQKLGQLQAQSQADKNNIDELQARLTKSIQQVTATQSTSRKDWLLAEVEYLLRLANQRVLMEQTTDGAIKLLKSADKILKETDDVSIYEVRKALASDIAALEAVPALDTEGVFLKLDALNQQVPNLRLIPISEQRKLPDLLEEVTPDSVSESWTAGLEASWGKAVDKLDKLVVIQHRDEPIEPLLSPEQSYYLQQNLHLMLEQAQLALLQRKQASYDASLAKAQDWISTYFEAKDSTTQSLLKNITELQSVKVTAEMPDISGSLRTLKGYLAQMAKLKEQGAS